MEAERRQVTVLFADMVGFTTFSERSGEEAAYTLMRSLSKLMDDAVHEQGGVVQSFTGDGIMAVFGAPVTFEDAPLRACRAALDILERLEAAAPDLEAKHRIRPQLRIGLNTGDAVVGRVQQAADAGITVLGDTVNFAARLQALAEPNSVFMGDATHRLVQGLVDVSFAGEHTIKGKSAPQKVYRLNAVRKGTSRFEAAIGRGLSAFVGREHELEVMDRGLDEARSQPRVLDLVAEPGMGKSRLVYEFRRRINKEGAFILTGSWSADGRQTPFLPFIEVVRGSFQVSAGEAEKEVARKLEMGLAALGLHTTRNLGLLLHLLGLKAPEGALTGLDGVLIGLRSRELLQQLLEARCRLSPAVLVIEDLHWLDSASEELLGKFIDSEAKLRLLILTTRRPEYTPPWIGRSVVTTLQLEPLTLGDIRRLMQTRLGVESLPDALARQLTEKAEGNPLFAEELVSFLTERGIVRAAPGKLDFDPGAVRSALPASVQGLISARVDRLAPHDRAILQAAAVIGRQFDPELLASVTGKSAIDARLAAMQALDLIYPESRSSGFVFKHALVRDALYQTLLGDPRKTLHAKIAEEIERRSGNRLTEVAETLAHHYGCTASTDKAFRYLVMAAKKSLDIYALEEAERHFQRALQLVEADPVCTSDAEFADMFAGFTRLLNLEARVKELTDLLSRHLSRIQAAGDTASLVLVLHHYSWALLTRAQFKAAHEVSRHCMFAAGRLGDDRLIAYGQSSFIHTSTIVSPLPLQAFEKLGHEALELSERTDDSYLRTWVMFTIAWDYINRGLTREARQYGEQILGAARDRADPRALGLGLWLIGWVDITEERYDHAVTRGDECVHVALTRLDRSVGMQVKGLAFALTGKLEEGVAILRDLREEFLEKDWRFNLSATDLALSVATVLGGAFGRGVRLCEKFVDEQEAAGYQAAADWGRLNLADVYLEMLSSRQRPPLRMLVRNLLFLLRVRFSGPARVEHLLKKAGQSTQFNERGILQARIEFGHARLFFLKRNVPLARQHLARARERAAELRAEGMLARIRELDGVLASVR
jgi:class 3 adenylate cyclase